MSIPVKKIYLRSGDHQTVYLDAVIKDPAISVGAFTMYNDFVHDPVDFEKITCSITTQSIRII